MVAALAKHAVCLQALGLEPIASDDEEEEQNQDQSDGDSSADEGIDDLDDSEDDSDAASSGSGSSEEEAEAGKNPTSSDRNPSAAKKRKTAAGVNGLGSVGWDASDEEEDRAEQPATGTDSYPTMRYALGGFSLTLLQHNSANPFL